MEFIVPHLGRVLLARAAKGPSREKESEAFLISLSPIDRTSAASGVVHGVVLVISVD